MSKYVTKVLFTSEEIQSMVKTLGKKITEDYQGKELVILAVLKGSFLFVADLVREIDIPCQVDFLEVSSYGNEKHSSGEVKILKDTRLSLEGKHVLVVEDLSDTGLTLKKLLELLEVRNPASLALCVAFDKPMNRTVELKADYIGLETPNEFVVGYGLDYQEFYRNLPSLCVLAEDTEENA